jgi:gluconolactonase
MAIRADSEHLHELVAVDATIERIGTGFDFTEGPIWVPEGPGYLLFSDMPGDVRRRYTPGRGVSEEVRPSNKGNGMTLDNERNLIVCEHSTSSVVRVNPSGARETLASHYKGKELNSPNDVVVKADGSIYFTDPTYGRLPGFGVEREPELDFRGLYRIPADGGELQLLHDDFDQPNGLCFSRDETILYVNDTERNHIRAFSVRPDGTLGAGTVFADSIVGGAEGAVDGMKIDTYGNVYVTGPGGIWIYDEAGQRIGIIEFPEKCANLNWAEDDWKTLYVTASTSVYRLRMLCAGNQLVYMS